MHIHLDPFAGISGDMLLASLIDAGGDKQLLIEQLIKALPFEFAIKAESVLRSGVTGTYLNIDITENAPPLRHLSTLLEITEKSGLSDFVKSRATEVFTNIAKAEAEVHGVDIEKIHFHEIGAGDTLIDVIGAFILIESMGVKTVSTSPVATGSGTVKTAHGLLPVPAPATAILLKDLPLGGGDMRGECTTPTGAALIANLADSYSRPDGLTIKNIGYGFGTRRGENGPNALRVMLLENTHNNHNVDSVSVLETTLDDSTGEHIGYLREQLEESCALEVSVTPVGMKESRPGVRITVIAKTEDAENLAEMILRESSSFGVRIREERRVILEREFVQVETPWGVVNVKIGRLNNKIVQSSPEYRDCKEIAKRVSMPIEQVYNAALSGLRANLGV